MKTLRIGIIIFFLMTATTHAAVLSVAVPSPVSVGTIVPVDVVADLGGESINSLDIAIDFPPGVLSFRGYDTTKTTVSLWITSPAETQSGTIHFAGIIPGGIERLYDPQHPTNRSVTLVRLLFAVSAPGEGVFHITQAQLLRNDGLGTAVAVTNTQPTLVATKDTMTGAESSPDTITPEPFTITLTKGSLFDRTPQLAFFAARDMQSGIAYYEAHQGSGAWHRVTNPYPLTYHLFPSQLTIRAVDFSGNYRDQTITVTEWSTVPPLICGVLLVGILVFYVYRKRRRVRI